MSCRRRSDLVHKPDIYRHAFALVRDPVRRLIVRASKSTWWEESAAFYTGCQSRGLVIYILNETLPYWSNICLHFAVESALGTEQIACVWSQEWPRPDACIDNTSQLQKVSEDTLCKATYLSWHLRLPILQGERHLRKLHAIRQHTLWHITVTIIHAAA